MKNQKIDLTLGENPEPFMPAVKAVKSEAKKINLYPDPNREHLTSLISKKTSMKKDQIYVSNGIDGEMEDLFSIYKGKNSEVIMPKPTFPIYEFATKNLGYKVKKVALKKDFSLDVEKLIKSADNNTNFIILGNPNNPTGNILLENGEIEHILKRFNGFLVIDEAYFEFSGQTCINLVTKYSNLIILRSFSKGHGLAGLRVGYLVANKTIVEKLKTTKGKSNKFCVSRLALRAAEAVMNNPDSSKKYIEKFVKNKREFEKEMSKIEGIKTVESKTSFSLFKTNKSTNQLKENLEKRGILIKSTEQYENFDDNVIIMGVPKKRNIKHVSQVFKEVMENEQI